ncbi:hypothetical protein HN51_018620 [Arachis hypogaea]
MMTSAYCKNGLVEQAEAFVNRLSKNRNELGGRYGRFVRGVINSYAIYVHGKTPETKAINMIEEYYHPKNDELFPYGKK